MSSLYHPDFNISVDERVVVLMPTVEMHSMAVP